VISGRETDFPDVEFRAYSLRYRSVSQLFSVRRLVDIDAALQHRSFNLSVLLAVPVIASAPGVPRIDQAARKSG
jgi:hypothetical protein